MCRLIRVFTVCWIYCRLAQHFCSLELHREQKLENKPYAHDILKRIFAVDLKKKKKKKKKKPWLSTGCPAKMLIRLKKEDNITSGFADTWKSDDEIIIYFTEAVASHHTCPDT